MITGLVLGIVSGSISALFALVIVLMYQTTGVLNIAVGAMAMVSVFTFSTLSLSMNVWLAAFGAIVLATLASALLGVLSRPAQHISAASKLVTTVALVTMLQGVVLVGWNTTIRVTPTLASSTAMRLGDVAISWQRLITVVASIVAAVAITMLFRRGLLGSQLRAVAANPATARLIGLPVDRLWVIAWALCGAAGALGGILVVPEVGMSVNGLSFIVLTPLAAALVARFRSPSVAIVAAVALGVADGLLRVRDWWGTDVDLTTYRGALPLVAVLASLLISRSDHTWERV
jgi:branched-chain amino acid transport system permease protein